MLSVMYIQHIYIQAVCSYLALARMTLHPLKMHSNSNFFEIFSQLLMLHVEQIQCQSGLNLHSCTFSSSILSLEVCIKNIRYVGSSTTQYFKHRISKIVAIFCTRQYIVFLLPKRKYSGLNLLPYLIFQLCIFLKGRQEDY